MFSRLLIISCLLFLFTCKNDNVSFNESINYDYNEIKERGKLIAVTTFNPIDYFIYKGRPMGFQLDMLLDYAEYTGLQLEIKACANVKEAYKMLLNGECDLIAMDLMPMDFENTQVLYTNTIRSSDYVLIQNKANENILKSKELNGKRIYAPKYSGISQFIKEIEERDSINIDINFVKTSSEDLIKKVSENEIEYTIADRSLAQVYKLRYSTIDNHLSLSEYFNFSWATRKQSEALKQSIDNWIFQIKKTSRFANIYTNYFNNPRTLNIVNSDYYVVSTGKLSRFDESIKEFSSELGWDWRLLASLIYSESKFDHESRSHSGAYGLMQIMPITANHFGYDTIISPEFNIKIGVKLLKQLEKTFEKDIIDPNERLKFVLASYNIGLGHVLDARRLAEKYGKNQNKWNEVLAFLLKKSEIQYYTDPVVKHGRCKGKQTMAYVENVLNLYSHYKNMSTIE